MGFWNTLVNAWEERPLASVMCELLEEVRKVTLKWELAEKTEYLKSELMVTAFVGANNFVSLNVQIIWKT